MRIGVHAKALSESEPTGVAEYTRQLLRYLVRLPEAREHRFLFYVDDGYSPGDLDSPLGSTSYTGNKAAAREMQRHLHFTLRGNENDIEYKVLRSPLLWTQGRLALELARHKPDVFFVPGHVLPKTAPKNSVVTIHGLEFERFPQFYPWHERQYLRWVTRDAVRRAARVIAVSEATKQDLVELYRVPENKISVVYHGASLSVEDVGGERHYHTQSYDSRKTPYFLYIGRIEKKKNVDGIIKAFAIVKERYHLPHKLILAGSDGFGAKEIRFKIQDSRFKRDIEIPGYISEAEKWKLLRGANAFVFPSWYEGFGLPILEAQVASVSVITSNVSAMPEVAGLSPDSAFVVTSAKEAALAKGDGGALYVDPADPTSIADAMRKVVTNADLRQQLIQKGLENCKRFSWEKCARETLKILLSYSLASPQPSAKRGRE